MCVALNGARAPIEPSRKETGNAGKGYLVGNISIGVGSGIAKFRSLQSLGTPPPRYNQRAVRQSVTILLDGI